MDNKNLKSLPKMDNDVNFRNYFNVRFFNNYISRENTKCRDINNNPKFQYGNEHQYRFFLQKNADKIMNNNKKNIVNMLI